MRCPVGLNSKVLISRKFSDTENPYLPENPYLVKDLYLP